MALRIAGVIGTVLAALLTVLETTLLGRAKGVGSSWWAVARGCVGVIGLGWVAALLLLLLGRIAALRVLLVTTLLAVGGWILIVGVGHGG